MGKYFNATNILFSVTEVVELWETCSYKGGQICIDLFIYCTLQTDDLTDQQKNENLGTNNCTAVTYDEVTPW